MAVRFDASGESYNRTLSLGSVTAFTVTMWAKLSVNRAAQTVFWQIDNSGVSPYLTVQALNGTAISLESSSWANANLGHTLTVGTWAFVGVAVHTDGNINFALGDANGTITAAGQARGAGTLNANRLVLGTGGLASQYLDGCIAAVKVWSGVRLTQDELLQEAWSYLPKRTADLRAWYPFLRAETTDYGGLAQTLSGGAGTSTEDGPPVGWGSGRPIAITSATPATGTLAGTLPALTGSMAGTVEVAGSLSGTLPALTGSAAGTVKTAGSLAGTLPSLTGSFAGAIEGGILSGVLPAITGSFAATAEAEGALSGTLPALTGAFAGEAEIPINDIEPAVGTPVRAWSHQAGERSWSANSSASAWTAGQPTT